MNPSRTATAEAEEIDDTADQREASAAAEVPKPSNPLTKFDPQTLKAMTTSPVLGSGMVAFLPASMAEAMEFAKLMASSSFVPPHLRGKPGDCLAIVLQSVRWRADPYAVAGKSYFVNDRMAFEAQLVGAVINSSNILDGRLQVTWQGSVGKPGFQCTVRGRIKGDAEVHELIQEIDTITTRNSPLWKQAQRVQLGYYTMRAWARLYTPEVLLGIYTPDEIEDTSDVMDPAPGTQQVLPPRPTRESVRAAAEQAKHEAEEQERHVREIAREEKPRDPEKTDEDRTEDAHAEDPEESEQVDETSPKQTAPEPEKIVDFAKMRQTMIATLTKIGDAARLDDFLTNYAKDLDLMRRKAGLEYDKVDRAIAAKKKAYGIE